MSKIKEIYDVIILGTGPAGLQAAIYTARAGLKTLVLGKAQNARLSQAHLISNYLGFPKGIDGKELLEQGIKQAENFGVALKEEEAIDISKDKNVFIVKTPKEAYSGKGIILATGVKNNSSGILGEIKFVGKGISFCVACDGLYFSGKKVAVVGEGDFAAKEALELSEYTKDISIYSDGKDFNISKEFKKQLESKKVKFSKAKIKEFSGGEKLEAVILENGEKINLDGAFIAKGTPKASDFARKLGVEIFNDFIICDEKGKTNIEGIFAAGDITGSNLQVAAAVGTAANAAFSAISFLKSKENQK